jgi:hypothetical protein
MVSIAMAKIKKFPKNLVTIDRRNSKDRRDVAATKNQPTKNAKKQGEGKKEKQIAVKKIKPIEEPEIEAPKPIAAALERREKVNRRRQIDPTTCEREYSDQEVEFMQALDLYKRRNGRMFPTCSEVLEVIRDLGYVKVEAGMTVVPVNQASNIYGGSNEGSAQANSSTPFESSNDFLTQGFQGASAVVEQPYFG